MHPALDVAEAKLSEAQFNNLFEKPIIGTRNSKEVLQWTYHDQNGSTVALWVPLKTKDGLPLPMSKVKNNIHNKCSEVTQQLATLLALPESAPPLSQTSINGCLRPVRQHSVLRGASSEITTNARITGAVEEVTEHYAADGGYTRHMKRGGEVYEETSTLKSKIGELQECIEGYKSIVDGHEDDMCQLNGYHNDEKESWDDERVRLNDRVLKLSEELQAERESWEEEKEWFQKRIAELHDKVEAREEAVERVRYKRTREGVSKQEQSVPSAPPPPPKKPIEFNPLLDLGNLWTAEKLLEYLSDISSNDTDKFPLLLNILDEYKMMNKISLHCEFAVADETVAKLWMPYTIVYSCQQYYSKMQDWRRMLKALDTSWDDYDKIDAIDKAMELKDKARRQHERKQEDEERAAKK
jgi:hypothetical protein